MKSLLCALLVFLTGRILAAPAYTPMEGDVVFQSLPNPPGIDLIDTIEGATGSVYSHCGMVLQHEGRWCVIEAIGPVQIIPLEQWRDRGRGRKMWVYRVTEPNRAHIPAALKAMKEDLGKPYDIRYRLDAEAIYCSELIYRGWKAAAGTDMGKTVKLRELNWQPYRSVIVRIERSQDIPLDREIITPRDLALAPQLALHWPPPEEKKDSKKTGKVSAGASRESEEKKAKSSG